MIEFRTLGGLELRERGESRGISAQPKRLALLSYLALADSSGFRRRDAVLGLLWPELDEAHARGALRQGLHLLRRSLGEDALTSRGEEEIGVNTSALWCDAVAFDAFNRAGQHDLALELYRGDFLEAFFVSDVAPEFEQWVEGKRSVFRQAASSCAWALADAKRTEGDIESAAALARRAASLSPADEAASARLIEFLDSVGDREGALCVHERLVSRLRSEYDTAPSPETQEILGRVRSRTVPLGLTGPRAVRVIQNPDAGAGLPVTSEKTPDLTYGGTSYSQPVSRPTYEENNRVRRFGIGLLATATIISVVIVARSLTPEHRVLSVAVMPLEDLGRDTSKAYVADGITDQLITDLAQVGSLQVINRRTMMTYRKSRKTPEQIARDLHADAVVSGTIQTFGDTVHMTAQLVLAGDDRAIWGQTFEGSRGDLLRMQREAARALAKEMKASVTPDARTLAASPGINPEALDLYIRGRYYWNKRGPGLLQSIDLFTKALDVDPRFALAWSGMADAYVQLGYGSILAPSDAFPKAREAANRAIMLDSTMAEPHATLAFVKMYYDWDWKGAETEFNHALTLNPSYATAHEWYGLFLAAMGRFSEAQSQERRAQELDPLSTAIGGTEGWVLYYSGRNDDAGRALDIVLRQDSTFALGHLYRGRVYEARGDLKNALAQYASTGPLRGWVPTIAAEGHVYGKLQRTRDANAVLGRLDSLSHSRYVTAYGVALVYAGLGQRDSAFAWLNRGFQERTHWMVWLNRDPRWNSIRADPRFVRLTRAMKLPD